MSRIWNGLLPSPVAAAVSIALLLALGGTSVALSAGQAPLRFGAKLTTSSQPANAEGGQSCSANSGIPAGVVCSWVSVQAYHNAGGAQAPRTGTIGKVRLVSCVAGSFRLQFARVKPASRQAKVVRDGPVIRYKADPRQVDTDPDTVCGGDGGDDYLVQTFPVTTHVNKGEYIAVRTRKTGALYCSGGSGILLFSPPLAFGGPYRQKTGDASCNLLVQLQYK
jgi:hypothetical protein